MSLLMVPGSFVKHPDGPVMLVVSATPFGFIGYRCSYKKQDNDFVVDLQAIPEDPVTFDYVDGVRRWKCVEVVPVLLASPASSTVSARSLHFDCKESFELLKFSRRKGIPNLTTFYLRKLYAELGCAHERGPVTHQRSWVARGARQAHLRPRVHTRPHENSGACTHARRTRYKNTFLSAPGSSALNDRVLVPKQRL